VRRQSSALYGVTGAVARGDLEYRISRHSTLGVDYRFTYFDYTRGFGTTDINSVGVNYSTQLTRHMQLSARIGGARVQSSSLAEVTLDPALAALLGETEAIQAAYRLNYVPDMQVRLYGHFPPVAVYAGVPQPSGSRQRSLPHIQEQFRKRTL
jgi:hypothetical protein